MEEEEERRRALAEGTEGAVAGICFAEAGSWHLDDFEKDQGKAVLLGGTRAVVCAGLSRSCVEQGLLASPAMASLGSLGIRALG